VDVTIVQAGTPPALSVIPNSRSVEAAAGDTSFTVANAGGGTLSWTAAVIQGDAWLTITSAASGAIVTNLANPETDPLDVHFDENTSASPRTGIISVSAIGATGTPRSVMVVQAGRLPGGEGEGEGEGEGPTCFGASMANTPPRGPSSGEGGDLMLLAGVSAMLAIAGRKYTRRYETR
jgi:hypothetical protein